MPLSQANVLDLVQGQLVPAWRKEHERIEVVDRWHRGKHDKPVIPRGSTPEYRRLVELASTPWLSLVVTSVAQALYVEGFRGADGKDTKAWTDTWQPNRLDGRQIAVHRGALAHGDSYVKVLPGKPTAVVTGVSALRMLSVYADPTQDEWPMYSIDVQRSGADARMITVLDEEVEYRLGSDSDFGNVHFIDYQVHDLGVCPVVRFSNMLDLDGRSVGEVEPFIALAGRIDQTTFDRLIVQRFASWKVRTIAGMTRPDTEEEANRKKLELKVEDILIADDKDTKFGTLPETPLAPFIDAKDADVRDLAAISQTPPHYLLGQVANLSGDALAAAESSLMRKVDERKHAFGESWEQVLRLAALANRDRAGAEDMSAQVRWRDTESRSLAQTASALGILAQQLKVPVEILWEKIPGLTDQDVKRAGDIARQQDSMAQLMATLDRQAADGDPAAG